MRVPLSRVATAVALSCLLAACGGGGNDDAGPAKTTADSAAVDTDAAETTAATADTDAVETTADTVEAAGAEERCAVSTGDRRTGFEFEDAPCDEPHNAELAAIVARPEVDEGADDVDRTVAELGACADSVEALTKRSLTEIGVTVGVGSDGADGQAADEVSCWLVVTTEGALSGSIADVGLDAALGDNVIFADLAESSCYVETDPDGYDVGLEASCDDPDALQTLAAFDLPDQDYADDDAIADAGEALCETALADPPFVAISDNSDDMAIVFPYLEDYRAFDQRTVLCQLKQPVDLAATNCAGQLVDGTYPTVPCDEPHAGEFAGYAPAPWEVLPEDAEEARSAMGAACLPVVEELVGRSLVRPGPGIGTSVESAGLGEPVNGDIECFVTTGGETTLIGLIADVGFDGALNGVVVVNDMEPGECFLLGEDAYAFGAPVDCSDPDALMHLGSFEAPEGPYPGEDELRLIRADGCAEVMADSGLAADPDTVSGTFPSDIEWKRQAQRTITCDATPL